MFALSYTLLRFGVSLMALVAGLRQKRSKRIYDGVAEEVAKTESRLKMNEVSASCRDYRNQARLTRLVEKQDRALGRFSRSSKRSQKLRTAQSALRNIKGLTLPYVLGVADILLLLYVTNYVSPEQLEIVLIDLVRSAF
jgi:hypothetical protein